MIVVASSFLHDAIVVRDRVEVEVELKLELELGIGSNVDVGIEGMKKGWLIFQF